ncbi:MAG: T9SS type A sorting domain-containing protein [Bacteroidota bacterium]
MKKIYTITLALFFAGSVFAQNPTVKVSSKLDENNQSFSKKGTIEQVSTDNQLKSTNAALNETFTTAIPNNWGAAGTGFNKWAISTTTEEGKATGATVKFAFYNASNATAGSQESLVTPILMPVTGDNTLSYSVNYYKRYTSGADVGAELYVEVSTDYGSTWIASTTNVLAALPNYNVSNTGWTTLTLDLSAYNTQKVMVRFRAVADYGWGNIGIDNVTGPNVFVLTNDISAGKLFVNMNSFDYFQAIPNSQLTTVDYGVKTSNNGSAAQTAVTLHANTNNGAFVSATGLANPTASLAPATFDTLWANTTPTATTLTEFGTKLWLTQTETDEILSNNNVDSVYFYGTNTQYFRTLNFTTLTGAYNFSGVTVATGFEFGATYFMPNAGRVDSISTIIYHAAGTANVVGKLYSIDINTGAYTVVGQTAPFTPAVGAYNDLGTVKNLALTTPYTATAGTLLAATIQLNGNFTTVPKDTILLGADNTYLGSTAIASTIYINVGGTFDWYSSSSIPVVGLSLQNPTTVSVNNINANKEVVVYPNPANNMLNIVNAGNDAKITIMNSLGQVVFNTIATGNTTINTENLSEGVYFVKVNSSVSKIIIKK